MDEEDWDADIRYPKNSFTPAQTSGVSKPAPTAQAAHSYARNDHESRASHSFGRGRVFSNRNSDHDQDRNSFYKPRSPVKQNDDNNNYNTNSRNSSLTTHMTIDTKSISAIIGKSGSTISNIREKCNVKIMIPPREELQGRSQTDIKIIGSYKIDIEKAKQMIEDIISSSNSNRHETPSSYRSSERSDSLKRSYDSERADSYENKPKQRDLSDHEQEDNPFRFRESKKSFNDSNDNNNNETVKPRSEGINWDLIRSQPLQNMSKFKDHPAVIKDFYAEDADIARMTQEEVKQFRKANFDIKVEFFKKANLNYCISDTKPEVDERTPEEIEKALFDKIPNPVKTIEQAFRNYPEILDECKKQSFINPTPIQSQLWPILLKGIDCVGIAQTGTGKTLAFLLPALVHIDNQLTPRDKRIGPNVLVLSPTRELAIQIEKEVKKINYKGIKSVCVYGGGDRKEQVNMCTRGVEIIIATPGRLYDLIQAKVINVTTVTFLVLDEADRMLDMGFEPQIMKILLDIRPDRQTVMTSATWPEGVRRLATKYLTDPIQLYVGSLDLRAAKTVTQSLEMVQNEDEKRDRLMHYIEHVMTENDKLMVFVGRKSTADNLSCDLALKSIQCQCIHGDREQCDREEALEDFKENRVRILIATDVASRGIDVKDITCVLNYDFPRNIEEYVHRVGRTGRAGRTGISVTFMAREDWKHAKELIEILTQGEQEVPKSLIDMAERFEVMKKKRLEEGGSGGGRGRGGFRGRGGGGGFGGGGFGGGGRRGGGGGGSYGGFGGFVF